MQKTTNRAFLFDLGGSLATGFILICVATSFLAYVIAPDNSVNANQMHLSIHSQPPGFKVKMLLVPTTTHKDHSRLSTLLFGNPNAGKQYPISSYQIEQDGIWIEHFNFDSPGQQEWFPVTDFNGLESVSEIIDQHIIDHSFVLGTDLFGSPEPFVGWNTDFYFHWLDIGIHFSDRWYFCGQFRWILRWFS